MKIERASSVCSDEAPSSPESIVSSPSADEDERLYSPAYSPASPAPVQDDASVTYGLPASPASLPSQSPTYSSSFDYPPSPENFIAGYDPYSPGAVGVPPGFCDDEDQFGCQDDFIRAVQSGDSKELKHILSRYSQLVQINGFTGDGQTALTQSCLDGNLEVVKLLVSHGASLQLTNRDGFSPIHIACWCGKFSVMQYLLRSANSRR